MARSINRDIHSSDAKAGGLAAAAMGRAGAAISNLKSSFFPNSLPMGQAPPPAISIAAPSPLGSAATIGTSLIGSDLIIRGENIVIISQNRLQIEGDVHGDVRGKEVTIGPDGSVTGTISAERIEVHGRVRGAIRATLIVVHSTANVDAEIVHEQLSVAEGAKVEGRLKRSRDANELIPNLDPTPYLSKQVTAPVLDSRGQVARAGLSKEQTETAQPGGQAER